MNWQENDDDDFYNDFYNDAEKCCVTSPPDINSPPSSEEIPEQTIQNNQCVENMDYQVNDDFYDEYSDNIEDCCIKVKNKMKHKFIPFTEDCKGVQEMMKKVHLHPKKVEEVINVFNNCMIESISNKSKVILLTGPPGCGKRFLLENIFKLFEFRVKRYDESDMLQSYVDDGILKSSHFNAFVSFLYACDKVPMNSYTSYGAKKVNLAFIDEIPNFIIDDPNIFSSKIVNIIKRNYNSIYVFLFTTSISALQSSYFRIFNTDVIEKLQVKHIKMLPVANTFMTCALKDYAALKEISMPSSTTRRVKKKEKGKCSDIWKRILNIANGDIRQGKIIIDFCTGESNESPEYKRMKFNFPPIDNTLESNSRKFDPSFLSIFENGLNFKGDSFHALGKLFYAKRLDEDVNPKTLKEHVDAENMLLQKLENLKRPLPPKDSVSEFVTLRPLNTSQLLEYVFEHEYHFAKDFKSLNKVYQNILTMDSALVEDHLRFTEMDNYLYENICRSLLYYNYKDPREKSQSNQFYHITRPSGGYKRMYEIQERKKILHTYFCDKVGEILLYKDLPDYQDYQEFKKPVDNLFKFFTTK